MTEDEMSRELLTHRLQIAEARMNKEIQRYWQIKLQLENLDDEDD